MTRSSAQYASLEELLRRPRDLDSAAWIEQRSNFAYASARFDGIHIARESVRILDGETVYPAREISIGGTDERETTNLLHLFDVFTKWSSEPPDSWQGPSFDEQSIRKLHAVAMAEVIPSAGMYRTSDISISGSEFRPPKAGDVVSEVTELCSYINENWTVSSSSHLAAYALWKILWIHPFEDGNGRVARAVAYLVFCLKAGGALPGSPTLPELLTFNRSAYYRALSSADANFQRGRVDVSELRKLIERLLVQQLTNSPAIDAETDDNLDDTFRSRVEGAPAALRASCYGAEKLEWRLWSVGSYLLTYVASPQEIRAVAERQIRRGSPFPGLLTIDSGEAAIAMGRDSGVAMLVASQIDRRSRSGVFLPTDGTAVISKCQVMSYGQREYALAGTLYLVRTGVRNNLRSFVRSVDLAISRHLSIFAQRGEGRAT